MSTDLINPADLDRLLPNANITCIESGNFRVALASLSGLSKNDRQRRVWDMFHTLESAGIPESHLNFQAGFVGRDNTFVDIPCIFVNLRPRQSTEPSGISEDRVKEIVRSANADLMAQLKAMLASTPAKTDEDGDGTETDEDGDAPF